MKMLKIKIDTKICKIMHRTRIKLIDNLKSFFSRDKNISLATQEELIRVFIDYAQQYQL